MTKRSIFIVPLVLLAAVLAVATPLAVRAEDTTDSSSSSSSEADQKAAEAQKKAAEQAAEQAKKLAEQRQEAAKQRQETAQHQNEQESQAASEAAKNAAEKAKEAFEKSCESNSTGFENRVKGIRERATNHISVLNNIDDRVEAYVKNNNLTVANYDALLTEVKTQRQLVTTLESQISQTTFSCGTDKVTTQETVSSIRDGYKQELSAIAAYKEALKNLIAAVKAAAVTGGTQ